MPRSSAVAETRRLYRSDFKPAAQLVDDQRRQRFAFHVLGDDEHWLAGLHHRLQQRKQLLQTGELLLVDENVRILHLHPHLVGIGDEIGGDVAAVELHAFDDVEFGLQRLGFLNGDDALVADLLHGVREELADLGVAIGGDGADLGDFLVGGDLLGVLLEIFHDRLDRKIDAALEVHRVHAGGDRLGALLDDGGGEHGCSRGAVASDIGGLGGDLAHHLRAHVLELVFELDFLGDGDAVLSDAGSAEALVENDIAALGTERHLHRIIEDVDAAQHLVAGFDREFDFLGSHGCCLRILVVRASRRGCVRRPSSWRRPVR